MIDSASFPPSRRLRHGAHCDKRRRAGYLMTDAVFAMGLIAVVVALLVSALADQRRASRRLTEHRAAVRLAEEAIYQVQARSVAPQAYIDLAHQLNESSDMTVRINAVQGPANWVAVTVLYGPQGQMTTALLGPQSIGAALPTDPTDPNASPEVQP